MGLVVEMLLLLLENTVEGFLTMKYRIQGRLLVFTTNCLYWCRCHISFERSNEENVDQIEGILQSIERSPTSTRRISIRIDAPRTRVWQQYVSTCPLHQQRMEHIQAEDEAKQLECFRW